MEIETMLEPVALMITMVATVAFFDVSQGVPDGRIGHPDASVERLADEVRGKGWIVFSARSERGDWDLFACRPDGSERRNITNTPDFNEAAAQFSRDGRRLLFRRLPREEPISGNHYGTQGELIIACGRRLGPDAVRGKRRISLGELEPRRRAARVSGDQGDLDR